MKKMFGSYLRKRKHLLTTVVSSFVVFSGLLSCYRWIQKRRGRNKLVMLMYHHISEDKKNDCSSQLTSATMDNFRKHIAYFSKHYTIVPLRKLVEMIKQGSSLTENLICITFDDGFKESFTGVVEVLKLHKAAATFFITVDFIEKKSILWPYVIEYALNTTEKESIVLDKMGTYYLDSEKAKSTAVADIIAKLIHLSAREIEHITEEIVTAALGKEHISATKSMSDDLFLSWQDIEKLGSQEEISFGSHGLSHRNIGCLNEDAVREELSKSKEIIEQKTHQKVTGFAYPFGNKGCFNNATRNILKETGYESASLSLYGRNDVTSDPWSLRRIEVCREDNLITLRCKVEGIFDGIARFLEK